VLDFPAEAQEAREESFMMFPGNYTWSAAVRGAIATSLWGGSDPGEIHGLKLGLKADEMSTDTFGDLACGSNGGPPRQAIDDWSNFRKCRPEPSGLHEVNVRFDDQQDYIGRAIDDPMYAQGRIGTRVAGHPVIL